MSVVQPSLQDRRPSSNLTLELPSNNPFRNRAASPSSASSMHSQLTPQPQTPIITSRPVSRNPFLDQTEVDKLNAFVLQESPRQGNVASPHLSPRPIMAETQLADFNKLALTDKPNMDAARMPPPKTMDKDGSRPPRSENVPPNGRYRPGPGPPPGSHRPTLSREEQEARARSSRARQASRPSQPNLDIFADPEDATKEPVRTRVRRNSDSSVMTARSSKLLDPNDERRRRDRERERRHRDRDGKPREPRSRDRHGSTSTSKPKKPNHRLDLIDKLDVTSIYGTGLFHHDGPFDACNPHRNRKGSTRAPMQAFPKDSMNNTIGGSGPVNKDIDHNVFHANRGAAEAFSDFGTSRVEAPVEPPRSTPDTKAFDSVAKVDPIHGDETLGLGTSTFLEGAPASRTAMQRRESESEVATMGGPGGLSRKKSLAQKIRGINNRPRQERRVTSGERQNETGSPEGNSPKSLERPFSSGSIAEGRGKSNEGNPFFNDYDAAYDKKGASIEVAQQEGAGRARAPSSPKRGMMQRSMTQDVLSTSAASATPGEKMEKAESKQSLLSRVKSLKGGKRNRPVNAWV